MPRKSGPHTYSVRFGSYLCQKDCGDLLALKDPSEIPPDDKKWSEKELEDGADDEGKRLQKMNRKACGILISSIKSDTGEGQVAFHMVEKTMMDKYAGGNFVQAYTLSLKNRYEDRDTTSKADLKESYYELKMDAKADPSVFVMKLEKIKIKLELHGVNTCAASISRLNCTPV